MNYVIEFGYQLCDGIGWDYERRSIHQLYVSNSRNFVSCTQFYPIYADIISSIPRSELPNVKGLVVMVGCIENEK
jgi:hypothetical protein